MCPKDVDKDGANGAKRHLYGGGAGGDEASESAMSATLPFPQTQIDESASAGCPIAPQVTRRRLCYRSLLNPADQFLPCEVPKDQVKVPKIFRCPDT